MNYNELSVVRKPTEISWILVKGRIRKGRLQLLVGAALEVGRWADLAVKEGDLERSAPWERLFLCVRLVANGPKMCKNNRKQDKVDKGQMQMFRKKALRQNRGLDPA